MTDDQMKMTLLIIVIFVSDLQLITLYLWTVCLLYEVIYSASHEAVHAARRVHRVAVVGAVDG